MTVPARFNDLADTEMTPTDTEHASVSDTDAPVGVLHTRLDSRRAENVLLSTVA